MSTKYNVPGRGPDDREFRNIGVDGGLPVKVFKDGSIEAQSFIDVTYADLYYEKYKDKTFYFGEKLDRNSEVMFMPKYVDKVYKTVAKKKIVIQDAFAIFNGSVRKLAIEDMTRFKHLPKRAKKEVIKLLRDKKIFHFTSNDIGGSWTQPYVESNTFGPYNYDVKIKATTDIEMIHDLIVIKTGSFHSALVNVANGTDWRMVPDKETIVYVSPHVVIKYDKGMDNYTYTGDHVTLGSYPAGATEEQISGYYWEKTVGVTNVTDITAISSKFVNIKSGTYLEDGHSYNFANIGEAETTLSYGGDVENTMFANISTSKHRDKMLSGTWDGVIPSGAYFRIETWSTNPRYAGFNGDLAVVSTSDHHEGINFAGNFSASCMSKDYLYSVRNAITKAEKKAYKKFNDYLRFLGIRPENSRKRRYDKLIEKVAQNVYDGIQIVNNTQLGSNQGTESNPWDSPMFYDGASMRYGGGPFYKNYDYRLAPDSQLKDIVDKTTDSSLVYGTSEVTNQSESNPFENYVFSDAEMEGWYQGSDEPPMY